MLKAENKFEEACEIAIELAEEDPIQFGHLVDEFHQEAKEIEKISEIRALGNNEFKESNYDEAREHYLKALN